MRKLTQEDKRQALTRALTSVEGAAQRWEDRVIRGLSDTELAKAIRYELGIAGGSGGAGRLSIHYEGAGLKIWASWQGFNYCTERPIYQGDATIKAARELFGIIDPNSDQLELF